MQPVSSNHIQNNVIPTPKMTSGQREATSYPVKTPLRRNPGILPEDVVTLTKDRSANLSVKKEPSAPVNASESKALRDGFSTYA
jgi:hypothetical protein